VNSARSEVRSVTCSGSKSVCIASPATMTRQRPEPCGVLAGQRGSTNALSPPPRRTRTPRALAITVSQSEHRVGRCQPDRRTINSGRDLVFHRSRGIRIMTPQDHDVADVHFCGVGGVMARTLWLVAAVSGAHHESSAVGVGSVPCGGDLAGGTRSMPTTSLPPRAHSTIAL
jgi:hypothetical protein